MGVLVGVAVLVAVASTLTASLGCQTPASPDITSKPISQAITGRIEGRAPRAREQKVPMDTTIAQTGLHANSSAARVDTHNNVAPAGKMGRGRPWFTPTLSTSEPNTQAGEPGRQNNGADRQQAARVASCRLVRSHR